MAYISFHVKSRPHWRHVRQSRSRLVVLRRQCGQAIKIPVASPGFGAGQHKTTRKYFKDETQNITNTHSKQLQNIQYLNTQPNHTDSVVRLCGAPN